MFDRKLYQHRSKQNIVGRQTYRPVNQAKYCRSANIQKGIRRSVTSVQSLYKQLLTTVLLSN